MDSDGGRTKGSERVEGREGRRRAKQGWKGKDGRERMKESGEQEGEGQKAVFI